MKTRSDMLLAIDANAIVHRAYHAFPSSLVNASGVQVNAVYGFTSMLLSVITQFDPKYILCALDTPKTTFRHKIYPDYKGHRKPTDTELISQMPIVEDVLNKLNIPILKKDGYEADDVLGTIAQLVSKGKWQEYGLDLVILTGDRDLLQLVGGDVRVALPAGGFKNLSVCNSEMVKEKYGYLPTQVVDYKAMVGDQSDNIPGIKGIGDKSALGLLEKYGDLDGIYSHISELKPRLQTLLTEGVELASLSKELATISRDVSIDIKLESALIKDFDRASVVKLFNELGFRSLIDKIPNSAEIVVSGSENQLGMFEVSDAHVEVGEDSGDVVVLDFSKEAMVKEFVSEIGASKSLVCSFVDRLESVDGVEFFVVGDSSLSKVWIVKDFGKFKDLSFTKDRLHETYFYNWENFVSRLGSGYSYGIFGNVFDIKLISHYLSSGEKGYQLNDIVYRILGSSVGPKFAAENGGALLRMVLECKRVLELDFVKLGEDAGIAEFVSRIDSKWIPAIKDMSLVEALKYFDTATSISLAAMENRGLSVDIVKLKQIAVELGELLSNLEGELYASAGRKFNVNSPKQLAEVLYDELGLPSGRGKSGRTTQESKLQELKSVHPIIEQILHYRELNKLKSTYVEPFILSVQSNIDSRGESSVNSDYNQLGASSGRFSSINPNMQNLPAKGVWASKFKEALLPRKGLKMVSIDYSQIDLRVMAHVSLDPVLIQDFVDGKDIHRETASRIFSKSADAVEPRERSFGKTINFGILYGQTKYGLAKLLSIPASEADRYISLYFENYKGIAQYVSNATKSALDLGYVQTSLGRRRNIGGLSSANFMIREAAVREAINMPIQGGSADVMKLAMVAVSNLIESKYKENVFLLLQIHDELVFECDPSVVDAFVAEASEVMESVVKLEVPLVVNAVIGGNMAELK